MKFVDVKRRAEAFSARVLEQSRRELIADITVEEPKAPEDELHFVRLVIWGFVYINEAGAVLFKQISRILKSSDPALASAYGDAKRDLDALRTWTAHNLAPPSASNERNRRLAEAWLISNGGAQLQWPAACTALAKSLVAMIEALQTGFDLIAAEVEVSSGSLEQLVDAIENAWPAHAFDPLVVEAAERLQLDGFDPVAYRKARYDRWREIAALFSNRTESELALKRVIIAELRQLFGDEPIATEAASQSSGFPSIL